MRPHQPAWLVGVLFTGNTVLMVIAQTATTTLTRRYRLGRLLASTTRHLLLLIARPHAGKDEDFQLFLLLLDPGRFEGRRRGASREIDTSDLMRRMVKERLLRFDGRPLFPERRAYTVAFQLSDAESELYQAVTTVPAPSSPRSQPGQAADREVAPFRRPARMLIDGKSVGVPVMLAARKRR